MLHLWPILNGLKRLASAVSLLSEANKMLFGDAPHRKSVVPQNGEFTGTQVALIKAAYARYLHNKNSPRPVHKNLDELVAALNKKFGLNKTRYAYQKVWKAK